jgi:predicted regulator of Ras-like GTPase activity (Roadblock/LC7/MglB family)
MVKPTKTKMLAAMTAAIFGGAKILKHKITRGTVRICNDNIRNRSLSFWLII